MKLIDKALLLKESPLFSSLPLDLLLPIAEKLDEQILEYGSKVFRYGELLPSYVYIVVTGQVELRDGEGRLLGVVKEGHLLGEEAVLSGTARQYEATCSLPTHLLTLSKGQFTQILAECPQITRALLEAFARAHPNRKR